MEKKQKIIKSRDRVADYGEVYTNDREVEAMLDLVKSKSNQIESRFLEPACGNGNFLIKILERKLNVVTKKYKTSKKEYEQYFFLAVSSIYGLDILPDNIEETKERLFDYIQKKYKSSMKIDMPVDFEKSIKYLLSKNIICGDWLSGLKHGTDAEPIIFSEWTIVGDFVKRKDFAMGDMVAYEDVTNDKNNLLKPRKEFEKVSIREVHSLG